MSHYVRPGDALDRDSQDRGNSVYFPRRVIPMLPEALSNELCSLKPEVDRLTMVCEMEITTSGVVRTYSFYPAVIHSNARLTYTRVAAVLEGKQAEPPIDRTLVPYLENLYAVFKLLLGARAKRGAIDFDSVETQMIFDDKGKIERIVRVQRNDAHRLIEECMLAANVCASDYLIANSQPTLYRIHEGPTPEKLEALRSMLKDFGLTLGGGDEPHAKDYAALLSRIKDKPYASLLQTVMLRSLRQAVYSPENVGHFGLAYEGYAHFTSPIRRYPDLVVHRAIKAVLGGTTLRRGQLGRAGRALLGDRAARGRRDAGRRELAQVLLHAGPRRRRVRGHRERGDGLRALRHARRTLHRRAGPYLRPGRRLLPVRPAAPPAARRAHRHPLPARRAREGARGAGGHRDDQDRLRAGRCGPAGGPGRGRDAPRRAGAASPGSRATRTRSTPSSTPASPTARRSANRDWFRGREPGDVFANTSPKEGRR